MQGATIRAVQKRWALMLNGFGSEKERSAQMMSGTASSVGAAAPAVLVQTKPDMAQQRAAGEGVEPQNECG